MSGNVYPGVRFPVQVPAFRKFQAMVIHDSHKPLDRSSEARPATAFTLDASLEYTRLVNLACMHLGFEVEEKQRLLELHDVAERGRRITTMLEREWDRLLRQHRLQDGGEESVH